jgi:hypothetical protein
MLIVLAAVELTFRVYLYGPAALNPVKMDSFNQVHQAGLLQPASNPRVMFELKPNLDSWYKGTQFKTNAAGLRDREYPQAKPESAFRIAVLGSSWTMGSGVDIDTVWHSRIEATLNESLATPVEIINFGVDQYGMAEIIATLESKALAYKPDLIVVALTYYTPTLLWPEPPVPYQPLQRRHPFFDLHALRVIDKRLGLELYAEDDSLREKVVGTENFNQQLARAATELSRITTSTGIPIAIVKLAYMRSWRQNKTTGNLHLDGNPNFNYLDVTDAVAKAGYTPAQMSVSVWDSHPNALAHELIATAVINALREQALIPE